MGMFWPTAHWYVTEGSGTTAHYICVFSCLWELLRALGVLLVTKAEAATPISTAKQFLFSYSRYLLACWLKASSIAIAAPC